MAGSLKREMRLLVRKQSEGSKNKMSPFKQAF